MDNYSLKQIYNDHELNWYNGFEESRMITSMLPDWKGKRVLEIGCGQGNLGAMLHYAGAIYAGVDYAEGEVERGKKKYPFLSLTECGYRDITIKSQKMDVLVMQGVLEHFDNPWEDLGWLASNLLRERHDILLSVPHWCNPRGIAYHALRMLCNAKMSLTDLYYFLPGEFETWSKEHGYSIEYHSCDHSRGNGADCIADFRERLPKAIPGVENLEEYLQYLAKQLQYMRGSAGATLGIRLTKTV